MARWSLFRAVVLATAVSLASTSAHAVFYSYTGNPYTQISIDDDPPSGSYTTAMRVTASFELSAPLAPNLGLTDIGASPALLSFSINDGRRTYSLDRLTNLEVATGASGEITNWNISAGFGFLDGSVGDEFGNILTRSLAGLQNATDRSSLFVCSAVSPTGFCAATTRDRALNSDQPGVWSVVPEPSTALLFGMGLATMARRRHR